ncbi:MAG: cache domain-containing protein [Sulfurimonas sp.]|nr:cache domain-containing protein [Sulfurimonas sp.]
MKVPAYLKKITILPPLFVFIGSLSVAFFHLYLDNKEFKNEIKEYKQNYYDKQKEKITKEVNSLVSRIKSKQQRADKKLKDRLQLRVDRAHNLINSFYLENRTKLNEKEMQKIIISILSKAKYSENNYYFIFQNKNNNELITKMMPSSLDKKHINKIKKYILNMKKNPDSFIKYNCFTTDEKEYKRVTYVKAFKPFNWVIGYGECYDEIEKELQKEFIEMVNTMKDRHPIIVKLLDIDAKGNYAKVLVNTNKPELVGKYISDNTQDTYINKHSKKVLKALKKDGYFYTTFLIKKNTSQEIVSRMSYHYLEKEWNWIIAYGVYIDDIEKEITAKIVQKEKHARDEIIMLFLVTFFLSTLIAIITYFVFKRIISEIVFYQNKEKEDREKIIILEQKEAFETLYQKSTDPILIIEDEKFVDCNEATTKILKASSKMEVLNCHPSELSPIKQKDGTNSYEKAQKLFDICRKDGYASFEWQHKDFDGEIFTVDIIITNIKLKNRDVIHVIWRDITEKIKLQEQNIQKQKMIEHQSRLAQMGEMIQNIAHQWKQPLAQINAVLVSMENDYKQNKLNYNQLSKKLDQIENLTLYMSDTIFSFSHYFDSKQEKNSFNVEKVIIQAITLLHPLIKKKDINININCTDKYTFFGDKKEFIQVILVILSNAMDIFKLKKITNPSIDIKIKSKKDKIVIEISDNAGGIKVENLDKIFEPFFTIKEHSDGSGMGLYMAKMIIENKMDGELNVQNKDDGALFTITI